MSSARKFIQVGNWLIEKKYLITNAEPYWSVQSDVDTPPLAVIHLNDDGTFDWGWADYAIPEANNRIRNGERSVSTVRQCVANIGKDYALFQEATRPLVLSKLQIEATITQLQALRRTQEAKDDGAVMNGIGLALNLLERMKNR